MSKISCIVNFKENLTKNISYYTLVLSQMNNAQLDKFHTEYWIGEHAAFAFTSNNEKRIDPISKICEGYQFIIVFDGELYNTASLITELTNLGYCFTNECDSEVVLNAYIHYGNKCVKKLTGDYTFIIYDTMRRQIFSASDYFASKPLFYHNIDDTYILSTQIKGILSHPNVKPSINSNGLQELLSLSKHCSGNIFNGITKLPAANILKIKDGSMSSTCYDKTSVKKNTDTYNTAINTIDTIISDKVDLMLPSETGVLLSGNIADDLLCGIISTKQAENSRQVTTYSFTNDVPISKEFSTANTHICIDESSLKAGLEYSVNACGLPIISNMDFLLPSIFERIPCRVNNIFCSLSDCDIFSPKIFNFDVLMRNHAFHPSVESTLSFYDYELKHENISFFNNWSCISDEYGIDIKTPLISKKLYNYIEGLPYSTSTVLHDVARKHLNNIVPTSLKGFNNVLYAHAKHILMEIIEDDNAPILAFFKKSQLLRLCEGCFDFSGCCISAIELITYLIKLNIWFLKYKPRII